jgi:hypothetical protein
MAWERDESRLSSAPLSPAEREQTRRVLRWYEHRVFLRASVGLWAKWLVGLPTGLLALWSLVQLLLHGK